MGKNITQKEWMINYIKNRKHKIDARPMFNGEYKAFLKVLSINPGLENFLSIGAANDQFYLNLIPHSKCVLVEPDNSASNLLHEYICEFGMQNKFIERQAIHPEKEIVNISKKGSIYKRRPLEEVIEAIEDGLYFCPYIIEAINNGRYDQTETAFECKCIKPSELLKRYKLKPDFIKIDVEGAEFIIIKSLMYEDINPIFIQYEYNTTWFDANVKHKKMFDILDNYYHYEIRPDCMILNSQPINHYIYTNFLASRQYLGERVSYT